MLGTFVILYLFLGGSGAALLGITCGWSLLFFHQSDRQKTQVKAFLSLRQWLLVLGFVIVILAALCLLMDLGHPEKAFLLFSRPSATYLSVGSFVLFGCLALGGILAFTAPRLTEEELAPGKFCVFAEVLCIVFAGAMLLYTGLYLAWLTAVPLWSNAVLPWLLAVSSLSSGLALLLACAPFGRDSSLLNDDLSFLRRFHSWVLVALVVLFIIYLGVAGTNPHAADGLRELMYPSGYGLWLIFGFGLAGVLVPLVLELFDRRLPNPLPLIGAELLCVIGGLILRFCLVLAGTH